MSASTTTATSTASISCYAARCGFSSDLSGPVTDRALFHCDNAYFYPAVHATSAPLKTNTVSNTAFRGFGGPQGMVGAERVIEEIAFALGKDPLEIRKLNFYGDEAAATSRPITRRSRTTSSTASSPSWRRAPTIARRRAHDRRPSTTTAAIIKRGIALTPVKFGISFTNTHFNQAGALVHVYKDGSVHLNHGGTEMGQGLYIKVAQVVAEEFQIDLDQVKITATTTGKVPNTSATAASSGSDLNGMAAQNAARQIKDRLIDFAAEQISGAARSRSCSCRTACASATRRSPSPTSSSRPIWRASSFRRPASTRRRKSTGTATRAQGRPFYYFAYGAACSEVSIDTLTGEYVVERTDILHDAGRSLNPAIDLGQVEGGFIQGMGWLTTEELWWDDKGRLRTHAPSTYKIPLASDRPKIFNVKLADWPEADEPTIHRSKAVGEPPFMLASRCCMRCRMRWRAWRTTRSARASTRRRRRSAC